MNAQGKAFLILAFVVVLAAFILWRYPARAPVPATDTDVSQAFGLFCDNNKSIQGLAHGDSLQLALSDGRNLSLSKTSEYEYATADGTIVFNDFIASTSLEENGAVTYAECWDGGVD